MMRALLFVVLVVASVAVADPGQGSTRASCGSGSTCAPARLLTRAPAGLQLCLGGHGAYQWGWQTSPTQAVLRGYLGDRCTGSAVDTLLVSDTSVSVFRPLFVLAAPALTTSFSASVGTVLQADTGTRRLFWSTFVPSGNSPQFDLGGGPHPVLERRLYLIDVGTESTSAPTWNPGPRVGGSTATVTVTEASAGASAVGTAPFVWDYRTSTTSTVAGNIALVTGVNTGAKVNRGLRWCQRILTGSDITSVRLWAGVASGSPTSSDTLTGEGTLFRFSTVAGDTRWSYCTRDGTTQSCSDTNVGVSANTAYLLCSDCREAGACTAWVDGRARVRKTTNLPTSGNMNPLWAVETVAGGTARTIGASSATVEWN